MFIILLMFIPTAVLASPQSDGFDSNFQNITEATGSNGKKYKVAWMHVDKFNSTLLTGVPLSTSIVQTHQQCIVKCIKSLVRCYSVNVIHSDDVLNCEVLSINPYQNSTQLAETFGATLYTFKSECRKDPCNGNPCIPNYLNNTFTCDCGLHYKGKFCEIFPEWIPAGKNVSLNPVSGYGIITIPATATLYALKFVYKSGGVNCAKNSLDASKFGCKFVNPLIFIFVTTSDGLVLYPDSFGCTEPNGASLLEGYNGLSDILVIKDINHTVQKNDVIQLWYSEVFCNNNINDNEGTTYVDAYVKFT